MSNVEFNFALIYRLSKLRFDELDHANIEQLKKIIEFVNIALTLDSIKDYSPLREVNGVRNVWREDVVISCEIDPQDLLASAIIQNYYVVVPRVI